MRGVVRDADAGRGDRRGRGGIRFEVETLCSGLWVGVELWRPVRQSEATSEFSSEMHGPRGGAC